MKPVAILPLLLLVASALLSGCATTPAAVDDGNGGNAGDVQGPQSERLPATADSDREIVLLPGEVVAWLVRTPGEGHLDVRFRVYQGLVDVTMDGPGECQGFKVQALMVSGPAGADVENKDCGELPAGTHHLRLHAGKAAFRGAIELRGGWFDGGPSPAPGQAKAGGAGPERPTDEKAILVTPGQPQDFAVRGQGRPMRLVIGMNHGLSVGGDLGAPKGCEGDDLSFNVLAVSTSGQALAVAKCPALAAGVHTFHLDAGDSAFSGYARLYGATFA